MPLGLLLKVVPLHQTLSKALDVKMSWVIDRSGLIQDSPGLMIY